MDEYKQREQSERHVIPLKIELPSDGFHKGVLWAGLADGWRHNVTARISDGKFLSDSWSGYLIYSSSN